MGRERVDIVRRVILHLRFKENKRKRLAKKMQVSFLWGLTAAVTSSAAEIKVACVNNIDMIRMADRATSFRL